MSTSGYPFEPLNGPGAPRLRSALDARSIPADVWAVAALVALATVIRIITIDNQSFWTDEALTAYEARLPFGAMLNTVAHVETTPPLYFLLIWAWAKVFGTGEVALRSVSTLAGIAIVPIAYLSARELVSRWAGVIAAAFVAVNPFLVWYSQEARAYMLLAALTGAAFLWFARARADPSRRNLTWWAALSALAVMTHFFAGFAIAPEALWLLWRWRTRAVAVAVGAVAAAQLAMVPFALTDTSHGVGWIASVSRISRIGHAATEWAVSLLLRSVSVKQGLLGAAVLFALVTLLLGLAGDRRTRAGAAAAAVIAGSAILIPLALGFIGQDYFLSRNVIPAFVPLTVVVAAGCAAPRARALGAILAVALLALFSFATIRVQTQPSLERPDWRNVARALGPALVPRAILAAGGTTADPLKIYLPHVGWVWPAGRRALITEIDVVGTRKRTTQLLNPHPDEGGPRGVGRALSGMALPHNSAPAGTQLLERQRIDNWVIARFALRHALVVTPRRLAALSPRFFVRTPEALLVFLQRPGR